MFPPSKMGSITSQLLSEMSVDLFCMVVSKMSALKYLFDKPMSSVLSV